MGVICDYFTAANDDEATATLDVLGGPSEAGLTTVQLKGIDPVVQMMTLEAILAGGSPDDDLPFNDALEVADDGERVVVRLRDKQRVLLSAVEPSTVAAAGTAWAATEEFDGHISPAEASGVIPELADLARMATAAGQDVYCWWSL